MSTTPSSPTPTDRPPSPPLRDALILLVLLSASLGGLAWWVLSPTSTPGPVVLAWAEYPERRSEGDPYVGSKACGECHPGIYALHTNSGHARTLRPAARRLISRALDGRTIADPERPGVDYSYRLDSRGFHVTRNTPGETGQEFLIDFALGSGHHATTFVGVSDPDPVQPKLLEHRLTHYADGDHMDVTPGQREGLNIPGLVPWGRVLEGKDAVKCLRCHSTRISRYSDSWVDFATLIPDVACERCHGPGRDHIEAARRGEEDLRMPLGLERWTADEMMSACGECHRHPANAPAGMINPDNPHLARFQPVGLMQSRCYTASEGALSCLNCHDPHARVESDHVSYESACLSCHSRPGQRECNVSPRNGCVTCHMPGVDSGQGVLFTDHWIRVREEARNLPRQSETETQFRVR